jgi:hypothetical protein
LYRRYPLLFLILASAVIVPYEVILLITTGNGPFEQSSLSGGVSLLLAVIEIALIGPLISALHVHAVATAHEGGDPQIATVAWQGLRALPVVAAASIMSWGGITLGFVALIVPGLILLLRWFVVAQAAAIEQQGWSPALRRSANLTEGHYGYVILLFVYLVVLTAAPALLIELGFGDGSTTVVSFAVGVVVQIFVWSFGALITALSYFELRARYEGAHAHGPAEDTASGHAATSPSPEARNSWDLHDYTEVDRPKGWYVDPGDPSRMRYWNAGDPPRWEGQAKTPARIRQAWIDKYPGSS